MKRIICLVLAVCLLSVLTACGGKLSGSNQEVYDVINTALDRTKALDSTSIKMDMHTLTSTEKSKTELNMLADIQGKNLLSGSPVISSKIDMATSGQQLQMDMYQEGDWAYVTMGNLKYKMDMSQVQSSGSDYLDQAGDIMQQLPEEWLTGIAFKKNSDGSRSLELNVPGDEFSKIFNQVLETTSTSQMEDVEITDCQITITEKDGYITRYRLAYEMTCTMQGVNVNSSAEIDLQYYNIGKDVTITPPEGYLDFQEIPAEG